MILALNERYAFTHCQDHDDNGYNRPISWARQRERT